MKFRPSLTLSFFLHAALLVAAVTAIGRDALQRVPFTSFYVELTAGSSAPPQHISSKTRRVPFPKIAALSPPPVAIIRSSQQIEPKISPGPSDMTKKDASTPPGKTLEEDSVLSRGSRFIDKSLTSGSSLVTSIAGQTETRSYVRSNPGVVEKMGTTHEEAVAAIRASLERAKYYPLIAKRRGIEGTATVEFSIDIKGMPEKIKIIQGSGSDILDSASLATVTRAAPFPHGIRTIKVPISFRLEKD